ncbi:uncharacterized protein LOC126964434 [Leptidea sinapis]|uniref:XK-related protein n=1 Tax=Leptidea sinapis TaxID=189913 RepID=A0A5E4QUF7_9NEOP|nr:uncharacterized protein LOC126964434 [Leptidea sinapis]VVD01244.1 unnamed protein product [Leptidea sinapis]
MRCELPVLIKCCFCVPLRKGLLIWAYVKMIINICLIIPYCIFLHDHLYRNKNGNYRFDLIMVFALVFGLAIDVIFQIIFIWGAHKKDYPFIRMYYRYSAVILVLMILYLITYVTHFFMVAGMLLMFILPFFIAILSVQFIYIFLQFYLMVLVRSEYKKLKNNSQFQFVNRCTEEPKCIAHLETDNVTEVMENGSDAHVEV